MLEGKSNNRYYLQKYKYALNINTEIDYKNARILLIKFKIRIFYLISEIIETGDVGIVSDKYLFAVPQLISQLSTWFDNIKVENVSKY